VCTVTGQCDIGLAGCFVEQGSGGGVLHCVLFWAADGGWEVGTPSGRCGCDWRA
jgi:hypothetical protein